MDKKTLEEIRNLVDRVVYSRNKADAKQHVKRLEFEAAHAKSHLDPYLAGKLSEVVSYAKEASGQVTNKEHWISCMESSWYVLESTALRKGDGNEHDKT